MARKIVAELDSLVASPSLLAEKVRTGTPLVNPSTFAVLQDAKVSPHRHATHRVVEGVARKPMLHASNAAVTVALQIAIPYMLTGINHYFRDHVSAGGRFHPSNTTEATKTKLRLVPAHNRLSEELFGHLDQYYSHRTQHAQLSTASAAILGWRNGTLAWYQSLPPDSRALYDKAIRDPMQTSTRSSGRQQRIVAGSRWMKPL